MDRMGLDYDDAVGRVIPASSTPAIIGLRPHRTVAAPAGVRLGGPGRVGLHRDGRPVERALRRNNVIVPRRRLHRARVPGRGAGGAVPAGADGQGPVGRDLDGRDHVVRERPHALGDDRARARSPAPSRTSDPATIRCSSSATVAASSSPATRPNSGTFEQFVGADGSPRPPRRSPAGRSPRRATHHMDVVLDALRGVGRHLRRRGRHRGGARRPGPRDGRGTQVKESGRRATGPTSAGAIVEVDDRGGGTVASPTRRGTSTTPSPACGAAPAYRGEDNREVFGRLLGLDDGTLDRLEADGVLSSRVPTG